MAQDNPKWGYDRIVCALANVGYHLLDPTVGNIVRRQGISPAPQLKPTTRWRDFIRAYRDVLVGTDFFTVDVLTLKDLLAYYVLFSIHLQTQRVGVTGLTPYPDQEWMEKQARNVSMKDWGFWPKAATCCMMGWQVCLWFREGDWSWPEQSSYLPAVPFERICGALGTIGETGMYIPIDLVRGELAAGSLTQYREHHHGERNHQGKGNELLFPIPRRAAKRRDAATIQCKKRLRGLLKYYTCRAA